MTMSNRPRVLTEQDAGTMDTLIRRGEQAATVAEQKAQQLQDAAADLEQVKGTIPAAAQSAAALATAQAKATLDAATLNATTAATQATLALATLPKFRSPDVSNPPAPTQAELDANPNGLGGTRLTADGATQPLRWTPHTLAGAWVTMGAPTATAPQVQEARALAQEADGRAVEARALAEQADTKADSASDLASAAADSLARVRVDATLYGVAEGADASTLMAAIAATPDGGTLTCPRVNLVHNGGRLMIQNRKGLTIEGNGLKVTARADLPDPSTGVNGGFYFLYSEEIDVYDLTYDGRLDSRTPFGSDAANTNMKSAFNVMSGCVGVRLHNCTGTRAMMDGFYVGHQDDTFTGTPAPSQANMPIRTELNGCTATYNYRQGLSVVGCTGLIVYGGRYAYTGRVIGAGGGEVYPEFGPCAGIDTEAYEPLAWRNYNVLITGNPEIDNNRGAGVLIENGTWNLLMDSGYVHHNFGSGVSFADNGTQGNVVKGVLCEYNCTNTTEKIEVVMRGPRMTFSGNRVNCAAGVRGIAGSLPGAWHQVCDNVVTGVGGSVTTGGIVSATSESLVSGNLTISSVFTAAGYGAIHVEGPGSTMVNNRAVSYETNPTSYGVYATAAVAHASGNSSLGYTIPVRSDAPGSRLTRPATPPKIVFAEGLAMDAFADLTTQTATVISDLPDVLTYRIECLTLHWDTRGANPAGIAYFAINPPAGHVSSITRLQAYNPNDGAVGTAVVRPGNSGQIALIVPDEAFYGMGIMVDVELRRA